MAKALIVFGSTTGNTEATADQISEVLSGKGLAVTLKNVTDAKVAELGGDYDITILGASTWGEDEIEFQEDFEPFYEDMDSANLKDKKVAVFGCGDSSYEYYCGAVDQLEAKVSELGGTLVNEPLRIDGDPGDVADEINTWAEEVAGSV
jgi:flavodoxin short chain